MKANTQPFFAAINVVFGEAGCTSHWFFAWSPVACLYLRHERFFNEGGNDIKKVLSFQVGARLVIGEITTLLWSRCMD